MVDVVLARPVVESDGVNAEISRGLLDLTALAHESNRSGTELRRERAGHEGEPSMRTTE